MPQRTLHTDRLTLRPLADEHLHHETILNSDAEVFRYLRSRPYTREESEEGHRVWLEQAREADGLGVWAGFTRAEPARFVGIWMLQPPHGPSQRKVPGEADLGYRLSREFWRRGLAKEGREGLTYVRQFHEDFDDPVPGTEEGEVEYEITRTTWETMAW